MARPSLRNGFEFSCLGIVLDQNHIFTRASCIQDDGSSVGNKISIIPILYNNSSLYTFYILLKSIFIKSFRKCYYRGSFSAEKNRWHLQPGSKVFRKNSFILMYVSFKNLCYKTEDLKVAWKLRSFIPKRRTILRKISKIFILTIYSSSRLTNPCG